MIADPQLQVMYIVLPRHMHHQYGVAAAKAGKESLCEKPLSLDIHSHRQCLPLSSEADQQCLEKGLLEVARSAPRLKDSRAVMGLLTN